MYAAFTLYFASPFFPEGNDTVNLLQRAVDILSNKIGRKLVMIALGLLGVLFTIPIFNGLG